MQPWAWAAVNGFKPIENRDRGFHYRGPLLVHTGKQDAGMASWHAVRARLREAGDDPSDLPDLADLPKGGIVGRAKSIGVITKSDSPWFEGPFGLMLANPEPLRLIPRRGQLGLFDIPDSALDQAQAPATPGQASLFAAAGGRR